MSKSDANGMEEDFGGVGVQGAGAYDGQAEQARYTLGLLTGGQGHQMAGVHGVPWSGLRGTRLAGPSIQAICSH